MIEIVLILAVALCVILSGFFSGSESGLYFIDQEKLRVESSKGNEKSKKILMILRAPASMIGVMLIGNNLVLQLATYITTLLLIAFNVQMSDFYMGILTSLILFPVFFVFGEVLPKATYRLYADSLLPWSLPVLSLFKFIFSPLSIVVKTVEYFCLKLLPQHQQGDEELGYTKDRVSNLLTRAYSGGVLSEEQMESIHQTLKSGGEPVEAFMTSIRHIGMVSVDAPLKQFLDVYKKSSNPVVPVYQDKKSNIIGTIDMRRIALDPAPGPQPAKKYMQKLICIEKGTPFVQCMEKIIQENCTLIFILSKERILGSITREQAITRWLK